MNQAALHRLEETGELRLPDDADVLAQAIFTAQNALRVGGVEQGLDEKALAIADQRKRRRFWLQVDERRVSKMFEWGREVPAEGEPFAYLRILPNPPPPVPRTVPKCRRCDDPEYQKQAQRWGCALLLGVFGFAYALGVVAGYWNWGAP